MLLLAAIPTFLSGVVMKFRPMMWGGVSFWILALVAHFGGPDSLRAGDAGGNDYRISHSGLFTQKKGQP